MAIRLAHLSDIHFGDENVPAVAAASAHVNAGGFDLVVVSGDFTQGGTIFRDTFSDSGSAIGPVILGGVRYASEAFSVGGEFRWHKAEADLDPDNFEAPKIDLGGWSIQATFGVRFD